MCLSLNGTWMRTLRHGAGGVLHSGVDCVVHCFSLRDRYQKSIVVWVMIYIPSSSVDDKCLRHVLHYSHSLRLSCYH